MNTLTIRTTLAALAVPIVLASAGCSGSGTSSDGNTIGASMLKMSDPDLVVMGDSMTATADQLGVGLTKVDAQGDSAKEMTNVDDLIARGSDAIIMMPVDQESSQAAAKRVNDADIPLFLLNQSFPEDAGVAYESYIGVDDSEAGVMQANYVKDQLPAGGKIIYLVGTYGAPWTDHRKTGFDETVPANVEIVSEIAANGSRDDAKRTTEDLLQRFSGSDVVGLVAQNDEMAIGAASAIEEAGRRDQFKFIIGVDGTDAGFESIQNGAMTATVRQDSAGQGKAAIETANTFLSGGQIEKSIILPFELVTPANLAEFTG